jgi:lysophospholipase L1-like esterase
VDMIGTLRNGGMQDNNHEGHSGEALAEIRTYWQKPLAAKPNVVLIHAGTNNMDLEIDLDKAPQLLNQILDGIYRESPYTAVLVAPVIWANDARMQKNTDAFNKQLRAAVEKRQQAGRRVLLAPVDIGSAADLADKKHPNSQGYQKFANAWFKAIQEANSRGWLEAPVQIDQSQFPGVGLGWNR